MCPLLIHTSPHTYTHTHTVVMLIIIESYYIYIHIKLYVYYYIYNYMFVDYVVFWALKDILRITLNDLVLVTFLFLMYMYICI